MGEDRSIDFKDLETQLYQLLLSDAIAPSPLRVECSLADDTLIIFIQYKQASTLETTATFSCVREFLDQKEISVWYPTKIHLTIEDQLSSTNGETIDDQDQIIGTFPQRKNKSNSLVSQKLAPISLFEKNHLRLPIVYRKNTAAPWPVKNIVGLGVVLGILVLGVYGLSDPCVTGTCPPLTKAEYLIQSSLFSLNPDSPSSLLTAKQQLTQAFQQLEQVPWWSPSQAEANRLKTEYQGILKEIDQLSMAIAAGNQATLLTQKKALSLPEWQTAQTLLKSASNQLTQLSPQGRFKPFAIAKQQEYQKTLLFIDKRLRQEEQANDSYDQAMKIARLAKSQEGTAQSVTELGVVSSNWKKAIEALQMIDKGTTYYEKMPKILDLYSQKFNDIDTRKNQEKIAQTNYQKAIQEAKIAKKSEDSQQWSLAVSQWNNALVYLKQIPANTLVSVQSQPLLIDYSLSLKKAYEKFTIANRLQVVKNNLDKICSQENKMCDYSVNKNMIQVNLNPAYSQQVWNLSVQAKLQANIQEQAEILNHLSRLEQSFQLTSNQAGIPLLVYDAKGNLMTTYKPVR